MYDSAPFSSTTVFPEDLKLQEVNSGAAVRLGPQTGATGKDHRKKERERHPSDVTVATAVPSTVSMASGISGPNDNYPEALVLSPGCLLESAGTPQKKPHNTQAWSHTQRF